MATDIAALITEGCSRLGLDTVTAGHRARVLAALNEAERFISQPGSFLYLQKKYSVTLNSAASSVPLPTSPAIDFGKSMSLRIIGEPGYMTYVSPDRFMTKAGASFYALRNDRPAAWTLMRDASQVLTIYVDPANTTGGNLTLELTAQMAVTALVDSGSNFSLLPDGYELTLLLGRAVAQVKWQLDRPDWKPKQDETDQLLQLFHAGQRVSKAFTTTDPESVQRKQDEAVDPESD